MKLSAIVGAAVLGFAPLAASAMTIYTQNFEGPGAPGLPLAWSGPGAVVGIQSYPAVSFGSQFLRNDSSGNPAGATKLTLGGLAPHSTVDLNFDLAVLDSWDGSDPTDTNPAVGDFFNVKVDGTSVFSESFSNQFGTPTYAGPSLFPAAQLGFGGYFDGAYHINLTGIAHTGSTLTIEFFASGPGWQGGDDESFAIDNVSVAASGNGTPVPTPAAFAGGALLTGLLAAARRRKA